MQEQPRNRSSSRLFGILAMAAGILLVMLEFGSYRRGGEVSVFWLLVAGLAIALGLYDIISRGKQAS